MSPFASRIAPSSRAFQENRADMLALVAQLREAETRARLASEASAPRFESRG